MNGEHIALMVVSGLLVVQQLVHHFHMKQYQRQNETLAKLLAARNYTDYSVGEARQERSKHPAAQQPEGYGSAFTDG